LAASPESSPRVTLPALAPVVLFVYNRPDHTRQTLEALADNSLADRTRLIIFSDAAKTPAAEPAVCAVRAIAHAAKGFADVRVIEAPANRGLANSVIGGVGQALADYGRAIVLEDDILTSPLFLAFMNEALDAYANNQRVFAISGYAYPDSLIRLPESVIEDAYLSRRHISWGWATWADRWRKVDWSVSDYAAFRADPVAMRAFQNGGYDMVGQLGAQMRGLIDSWALRFGYAAFRNDAWMLIPRRSLTRNIGFDGSGVHCDSTTLFDVDPAQTDWRWRLPLSLKPDPAVLSAFYLAFRPALPQRIKLKARRWLRTVRDRLR
jgi:GT2 family glycosyltransferase